MRGCLLIFAASMKFSAGLGLDFEVESYLASPPVRAGCMGSAGSHGKAIMVTGGTLPHAQARDDENVWDSAFWCVRGQFSKNQRAKFLERFEMCYW